MNPQLQQVLIHSLGAFGGTLGYAFLLNAPLCTVLPASLTGLLGYVLYELLVGFTASSMIFSYFIATVVIAVICEFAARIMRMPSTIFLLTALVPLVPGYTFYCMMLAMVEDHGAAAATSVLFRTLASHKAAKKAEKTE